MVGHPRTLFLFNIASSPQPLPAYTIASFCPHLSSDVIALFSTTGRTKDTSIKTPRETRHEILNAPKSRRNHRRFYSVADAEDRAEGRREFCVLFCANAMLWFNGLFISNAKNINIYFQIKYTEAILSNSTRKLSQFQITELLNAVMKEISLLRYLLQFPAHFRPTMTATSSRTSAGRKHGCLHELPSPTAISGSPAEVNR